MELQVFTSQKGTKVVTASALYHALELAPTHYNASVKKWINEFYQFRDGIRKPERFQDFATRKVKEHPVMTDYYLSVELAKLIALNSNSKLKLRYAKYLYRLEEKEERIENLSAEQVKALIKLTKEVRDDQKRQEYERAHLKVYKERNGDSPANWWKYREQLLGYSLEALRRKYRRKAHISHKQILADVDPYELIRTGIIDCMMSMGKTAEYARNVGDLAKSLAKELNLLPEDVPQAAPTLFSQEIIHPASRQAAIVG